MRSSIPVLIGVLTLAAPGGALAQPTLREAFKGDFLIGAALNEDQFSGRGGCAESLIPAQFNAISPENALKWASIHPALDQYNFGPADRYVEFGREHGMFIVGHTLVWHNQTPGRVFQDAGGKPVARDILIQRMRDHIATVVGRYRGKIEGWDVVNEALNEDGTLRQSPWLKIIGEDYILLAYQAAHEADPSAQLFYNDYSLENAPKREGAIRLIRKLQSHGIPVAAIGLQGHYRMDWPTPAQLDETIRAFAPLGIKTMVTELDVDVLPPVTRSQAADVSTSLELQAKQNPYTNGLPDPVQQALARRYADLFGVLVKHHDRIARVTFWGVTDAGSWLNNWPADARDLLGQVGDVLATIDAFGGPRVAGRHKADQPGGRARPIWASQTAGSSALGGTLLCASQLVRVRLLQALGVIRGEYLGDPPPGVSSQPCRSRSARARRSNRRRSGPDRAV